MAEGSPADIKSRVFRGISALYLVQLFSLPLSILTNLLAGKLLDPANYGSFASAIFVVTVVSMVSELGLIHALMRQPGKLSREDYATAFGYQLFTAVAITGGLFVAAPYLGYFLSSYALEGSSEVIAMTRMLAVLPILNAFLTIPQVMAERELYYGRLAWASGACSVLERLVLVGFMVLGLRGYSYVYSRISGVVLQGICYFFITRWNPLSLAVEAVRSRLRSRNILRFGAWIQVKYCANPIGESVVPVLAGRLFGSGIVGLLTWSNGLASLVGLRLPQVSARVLIGAANQFSRGGEAEGVTLDLDAYRAQFEKILLVSSGLIAVLLAVLAATIPELLAYFFKPQWKAAGPFFVAACVNMSVGMLLTFYDALAIVLGYPRLAALASWVWALVAFGCSWWFSQTHGPIGIVYGQIASAVAPTLLLHFRLRKLGNIEVLSNFVVPMLVGLGVWALSTWLKGYFVFGLGSLIAFMGVMTAIGLGLEIVFHPKLPMITRNLVRQRLAQRAAARAR